MCKGNPTLVAVWAPEDFYPGSIGFACDELCLVSCLFFWLWRSNGGLRVVDHELDQVVSAVIPQTVLAVAPRAVRRCNPGLSANSNVTYFVYVWSSSWLCTLLPFCLSIISMSLKKVTMCRCLQHKRGGLDSEPWVDIGRAPCR